MEPPDSSWDDPGNPVVVDRPAAVALLLDPERRDYLHPFMLGERSVAEAAADVGLSVKDMAYRVKRMHALGLLRVTRVRPRAGRPIRSYRAARAYFVPFAATPDADLEDAVEALLRGPQRQLVTGLVHNLRVTERDVHRWGWRFELDAGERISIRPSGSPDDPAPFLRRLLDDDQPAVYVANLPLRLDHAQAKQLQRDLAKLLAHYDGRNGADVYVLSIGLTPARGS